MFRFGGGFFLQLLSCFIWEIHNELEIEVFAIGVTGLPFYRRMLKLIVYAYMH